MTTLKAASPFTLLACSVLLLLGAWAMTAHAEETPPPSDEVISDDERDYRDAVSFAIEGSVEELEALAIAGNVHAQYFMGAVYATGREVDVDLEVARKWLKIAAERDHVKAQLGIGGMLLLGKGGPKEFAEGIDWLKRAADAGNSTAQIQLGRLYFEGAGDLPIDRVEAYVWFSLATINPASDKRHQPSEAQLFLDDLESNYLEESQIAEARSRAIEKIASVQAASDQAATVQAD